MTDDEQFEYFWDLYAKKVARTVARRAWDKLSLDHRRDACTGLKDRVAHDRQWLIKDEDGRPGKLKPHPATYLNGHRWNDEWERHIPRAQRKDNVRDTTKPKVNLGQEQAGLAKLREMAGPDNDPTPLNLGKSSADIQKEAMAKMLGKLGKKPDYKVQDEASLQARKQKLQQQANSLLEQNHGTDTG